MHNDASITKALKRIEDCLVKSLPDHLKNKKKTSEEILKIHGMHKDFFDFINRVEELLEGNIADTSIDSNANKNEVTIPGILVEATASVNKVIGYRMLYRQLKKTQGEEEAQRLLGNLYNFSLAIADSTKMLLPYCFSFDASQIVLSGRNFGLLPSAPPKRLTSYIAALNETVHQLSNHVAGALAVGSFFFDVAHVLYFREGMTSIDDLKRNQKYIENNFQNFIHSVNHLSRNAVESPFTNISIFDRQKLSTFLQDDNLGWYFQSDEHDKEFFIDYIMHLQYIFLDFFDRGDPLNGGRNYRFPVVTVNISKHRDNQGIHLLDQEFIRDISRREIYRYNVLVSEGSKVASCCRLLNNFELLEIGGQMNSFGGSGISLGSHRVVTINFNRLALEASSYEEYKQLLDLRVLDASKVLEAHRELIKELKNRGLQPFLRNGYLKLDRMFSTLGVLGLVEAQNTLKEKFTIEEDVIEYSLKRLNDLAKELTIQTKNIYNIEQIPGESMAPKLAEVDRLLYGEELVPYRLYSNQFIPLWEDADLYDRMQVDGKYNQLFTGGGIVHFNLGEKVRPEQVEALISYACTVGCEHFALNPVYSLCENKHNSFGKYETCPVCAAPIVDYFTRVVGFFVPVSSFNKIRRDWEFPKRAFKSL